MLKIKLKMTLCSRWLGTQHEPHGPSLCLARQSRMIWECVVGWRWLGSWYKWMESQHPVLIHTQN